MDLRCPNARCPNRKPPHFRWYDYHGTYPSCGLTVQRYRCRVCGKTFSRRTLSIDYWTHFHLDYLMLMNCFASGFSVRGLSRFFNTSVKTIQNRFSRLARTIIPTFAQLQQSIRLTEDLVADGIENFCVSQDFPNNIHLLVGKESQFAFGLNYALMRRSGRMTDCQKNRCAQLYPRVDFTRFTIKRGFAELIEQMKVVAAQSNQLTLYTDERSQYQIALNEDPDIHTMCMSGRFKHVRINSELPRTILNDLFSVNYLDRELRKDVPEFRRETVCFGRNVGNMLERLIVYLYHHNFIKRYRIGVSGEDRTHAEVAGVKAEEVENIGADIVDRRRFLSDREIPKGGFYEQLWRRKIPTPLARCPDRVPQFIYA